MRTLLFLLALLGAASAEAQPFPLVTQDGYCVSEEGGWVFTRACTPAHNQYRFVYHARRNAFVFETNSGGCLSPDDGSGNVRSGVPLRSVRCNGRLEQDWWHAPTGQIQNKRYTNLCVDTEGGLGPNRRVLVFSCDLNPIQHLRAANQRYFMAGSIRPRASAPQAAGLPSGGFAGSGLVQTFTGGAQVIAASGGNVIAAGGGNVIAAGGGNVIAAGGGN